MKKIYTILGIDFELDIANIFDELSSIDFYKTIDEQLMVLDEDLLLLTFKSGYIVDVGWYPAFEKDGRFVISEIIDGNWNEPAYQCAAGWDRDELINKRNNI
ncbi:hypothetical protein HC231_13685 [Brenneria izadpanahii]|uniref:Uncharacterized protein n=1 Tax=Brenneria izadpanahii TaxID=2722756 RepID=A0ABX7USX1_9GAMM|nr:hypothetical protein [Brenneria izadpanahii]QTF08841.1 hypothetical protein HC231_13685 [Brenneria izadpanahii]